MNRNSTLLTLFCLFAVLGSNFAQSGGKQIFSFLNLPTSARLGGLGGYQVALQDDDITLAAFNPAALNQRMDQQMAFTYNAHLAKTKQGYAAYGQYSSKLKMTFHAGIQFMQYGSIPATDEFGEVYGSFKPAEWALHLGAAKSIGEKLTVGANLRFVQSNFEAYKASGLLADIGAVYSFSQGFTGGLVVRNVGEVLSNYTDGNSENTPIDIQLGISKKLNHLPFRFGIVAHQLQRWDVSYDDPIPDDDIQFLDESSKGPSDFGKFTNTFFKHFIINGEFLLGKNEGFRLRFAYNHLRHSELKVPQLRGLGGFSLGTGIKISKFNFDYGISFYHPAGAMHQFTLATNLHRFAKSSTSLLN
ncbi:MAG: type IX secretion system protein PorQ [Saprospiraceae bacterium]